MHAWRRGIFVRPALLWRLQHQADETDGGRKKGHPWKKGCGLVSRGRLPTYSAVPTFTLLDNLGYLVISWARKGGRYREVLSDALDQTRPRRKRAVYTVLV